MSLLPSGPTTDASAGGTYQTGSNAITYMGMPATEIVTSVKLLTIPTGFDLPQALDFQENGVLLGFTVAVNDPQFEVDCILYGSDSTPTVLNDSTMEYVSALGRGLTHGQATAVGPMGQSLDSIGVKNDQWPWLQRYRSTFSLDAIKAGSTYQQVAGTLDDVWIVLAYTPSSHKGYTRLFFDISNDSINNRIIHYFTVSRVKFQNQQNMQYTTASANLAQTLTFG